MWRKIVDLRKVEDNPKIEVVNEQLQKAYTFEDNSSQFKNQDPFENVDVSPIENPKKRTFDLASFAIVVFLLFRVLLIGKFSNSDETVNTIANPRVALEESEPLKIDLSKVGKNPTFGEMEACDLIGSASITDKPESNNSTYPASSARSVENIVREGLRADCTNRPFDFRNLLFQYRVETFNSYGELRVLYELGNTNLTYLDQGSTARIGYSDDATYAILNRWQCVFPFNTSK